MVVMGVVNLDPFFRRDKRISLFILTELPDINVSARPVLGPRPRQAARIALKNHHFQPMSIVETSHLGNDLTIILVALLVVGQHLTNPPQHQTLRRPLTLRQPVNAIQYYRREALLGSKSLNGRPVDALWQADILIHPDAEPE